MAGSARRRRSQHVVSLRDRQFVQWVELSVLSHRVRMLLMFPPEAVADPLLAFDAEPVRTPAQKVEGEQK